MFDKTQRRLILGLLLIPAVLGANPFNDIERYTLSYEHGYDTLLPVFESLRQYGKNDFRLANNELLKQYLVAAVLTEHEYNSATNWSNTSLDLLEKDGRVKTYINENRGDQKLYHGEMMFLNDPTELQSMVNKVRNNTDTKPYIILYSYYIPCANISRLKYSCSEELASFSKSFRYPMFIAFSVIFNRTDPDLALNNLQLASTINVFLRENQYKYPRIYYKPAQELSESDTFQSLYSQCLTDMRVSRCGDRVVDDALKATYINMAVYKCTKDSTNIGMLTRSNRMQFINCFANFIDSCSMCKPCSPRLRLVRFVFKFCLVDVLRSGLAFGQARSLQDTTWVRTDGPWKNILPISIEMGTIPKLPCNVRANVMDDCLEKLDSIQNTTKFIDVSPYSRDLLRKGRPIKKEKLDTM